MSQPIPTTARDLSDAAMLVACSIRCWGGVKRDRKVTQHAIDAHQAQSGAGHFDKHLIHKDSLKGITTVVNAARGWLYQQTLPWGELDGERILPAANFVPFTNGMVDHKSRFEEAVRDFVARYPDLIANSRERLGDMFREGEYPEPDELPGMFSFEIAFRPLPKADDFRVNLSAEHVAMIKADIERRNKVEIETAMASLWDRVHDSVSSLVDQLKRFDEPTVDASGKSRAAYVAPATLARLEALIELLPRLNVTNDPNLEGARRILLMRLHGQTPDDLRDSPAQRRQALAAADQILALMGGTGLQEAA